MSRPELHARDGFSLIEAIVAVTLAAVVLGGAGRVLYDAQAAATVQPRIADVQQQLRAAADALYRDLVVAGAGFETGDAGALSTYLPAVLPARTGLWSSDPELSYASDRITVFYAAPGPASLLTQDALAASDEAWIDPARPGCPPDGVCGFREGIRLLVFDPAVAAGGFDTFTVTAAVPPGFLGRASPNRSFSHPYPAGSIAGAIEQRVYHRDEPTRRLMVYDGFQSLSPVAEHITHLSFEYLVDRDPSSVRPPPDDQGNCAYAAGTPPVPLLDPLGGSGVALADAARFTDGPWCGAAPGRFDADLLRVRGVRVTVGASLPPGGAGARVEAAVAEVRVTFDVWLRNR